MKERTRRVPLTFSVHGEAGKTALVAKDTRGCDCRDGKLRVAPGGVRLLRADGTPWTCDVSGVSKICVIKKYDSENRSYSDRFAVLTENGEFYTQNDDGTFVRLAFGYNDAGTARLVGVDNRSKLVLISASTCLFVKDDGGADIVMLDDTCKTGCFFKHRLFVGMKPAGLACSAPEQTQEFTESVHGGGLIRFPNVGGEIVSIKVFKDKLYVFFEYGLLKVEIGGSPKDFTAEELEYAGGKIFGRTVCVGNDAIFFLAADGLYRFDGTKVKRLFPDFVSKPKEQTLLESAATFQDRVLLRYMTQDGYKTLVVYEDGKNCFYMDGLRALSADDGGRCLFIDDENVICELSETGDFGAQGEFFGAETDFGIVGRKTLTKLRFEGQGSFLLTVKNGGRIFSREVRLKNGVAEVKLSERGERFTFGFALQNGAEIASAVAEVKTVKRA